MNKLLETIKENDDGFNRRWTGHKDGLYTMKPVGTEELRDNIKSHFTQSRIKELEALIKMIWKKDKPWGGDSGKESDRQVFGYNKAIADVIELLENTIKELKQESSLDNIKNIFSFTTLKDKEVKMERSCRNCAMNFFNKRCLAYNFNFGENFIKNNRLCFRWKRLQKPSDIGGHNEQRKQEKKEQEAYC